MVMLISRGAFVLLKREKTLQNGESFLFPLHFNSSVLVLGVCLIHVLSHSLASVLMSSLPKPVLGKMSLLFASRPSWT